MEFELCNQRRESFTNKSNKNSNKPTLTGLNSSTKPTMRKLEFSPLSTLNTNETSCGSVFSDNSDNSSMNSDSASFLEDLINNENNNNPRNQNKNNHFYSPLVATSTSGRRRSQMGIGGSGVGGAIGLTKPTQSLTARKLLKEKSKSDSFFDKSLSPSNQEEIIKALEASMEHAAANHHDESERLVGDLSRKHSLPILRVSKHRDLASISADTLVDLMDGKYAEQISEFSILDARYPYEFAGGHITGAENAYVIDELFEKLFSPANARITDKPRVLIIHCEFSSERGPKLMREIRERDRMLNKHKYPCLFYPEMYLLENGYKQFYELFSSYCSPQGYLPMSHDNHKEELKFFRRKSKTWDTETRWF